MRSDGRRARDMDRPTTQHGERGKSREKKWAMRWRNGVLNSHNKNNNILFYLCARLPRTRFRAVMSAGHKAAFAVPERQNVPASPFFVRNKRYEMNKVPPSSRAGGRGRAPALAAATRKQSGKEIIARGA